MDKAWKPRRNPRYKGESLDGEELIYDLELTRIVYCNQTAALIWRLCDGERSVQELIALLSEAFPEAAENLVDDVEEALLELKREGALE